MVPLDTAKKLHSIYPRPESPSTTESISEIEEDLHSGETTDEPVHDDIHCEEVEKLKDLYCTTAHCKHFYSKHCYDIVDGVQPTCEKVRSCIEARVGKFRSKSEKHPEEKSKNGSGILENGISSLALPILMAIKMFFYSKVWLFIVTGQRWIISNDLKFKKFLKYILR